MNTSTSSDSGLATYDIRVRYVNGDEITVPVTIKEDEDATLDPRRGWNAPSCCDTLGSLKVYLAAKNNTFASNVCLISMKENKEMAKNDEPPSDCTCVFLETPTYLDRDDDSWVKIIISHVLYGELDAIARAADQLSPKSDSQCGGLSFDEAELDVSRRRRVMSMTLASYLREDDPRIDIAEVSSQFTHAYVLYIFSVLVVESGSGAGI